MKLGNSKILSKEYRPYLICTVIVLFICVSAYFFIRPKLEQIFTYQKKQSQLNIKLERLNNKIRVLNGLDVGELTEKTNVMLRALPAEKDPIGMFAIIRNSTREIGLELERASVEPGEISTPSAQTDLDFQVSVVASGSSLIKDLISKIELSAPIMRITNLRIISKVKQITASFNLLTFTRPISGSIEAVDKPISPITSDEEEIYQRMAKLEKPTENAFAPVPYGKENPFSN